MEHFELGNSTVKNIFVEYRRQSSIIKELKSSNVNLLNEIKRAKENLNTLIEQQKENICNTLNTESIHLLYISLKEKNDFLLKEIENVKQEKEILVKHYEEKILFQKDEAEKERRNVKLKENEYNDKFLLYQASTALQNDEMESMWQDRLNIVNQQLKDSNMSCNLLRNQLVDVKNRLCITNSESEKRIQELEQSLVTTEEHLRRAQEQLINNQQSSVRTYRTKSNLYTKSRPYAYVLGKPDSANSSYHSVPVDVSANSKSYEPLNITKELNKSNSITDMEKSPPRKLVKRKLYNLDEFQ